MATVKITKANLYKSVKVTSLLSRRRGKHHDLTEGIMRELKLLKKGRALKLPLAIVGGVEVTNLRSAVHRAAAAAKLEIKTQSDEKNLYVWLSAGLKAANSAEGH